VRKPLLCVSIAAALSLSVAGASAHTAVLQNSLVFDPVATGPNTISYNGQVFGAKPCRDGRLIDIYVGGVLFTTVTTNPDGTFTASGPLPPAGTMATAVARKKVQRSRRHKHKCPQKMETKKAA
jgi:hypothetical protein